MLLNPILQFEIRFIPILNFPGAISEIITPFFSTGNAIRHDRDGTNNQPVIVIEYSDRQTEIQIRFDRILFKCNHDRKDWDMKNSFVEEPFLNLFQKLKTSPHFSKVLNILYFGVFVYQADSEKTLLEYTESYSTKILTKKGKDVLQGFTDVATIFERKVENKEESVTYAPYIGLNDIKKLGFNITDVSLAAKLSVPGEIFTYKCLQIKDKIDFSTFKELNSTAQNLIAHQWNHQ